MDLSLKKPASLLSQDLPQDLSIKKHRSYPAECKPSLFQDFKLHSSPHDLSVKNPALPPVLGSKLFGVETLGTLSVPRAAVDLTSRKAAENSIRSEFDLKTATLADQTLRTLAHQKARSFAVQGKRKSTDLKSTALKVTKASTLVIPDPRNRTKKKRRSSADKSAAGVPRKPKSIMAQLFMASDLQEGLDLRKKTTSSQRSSPQLPSYHHHQQQQSRSNKIEHILLQALSSPIGSPLSNGWSFNSALSEKENPNKRKRKQDCPRKRIKLESNAHEEVEEKEEEEEKEVKPAFVISEEFLDEVTDAAQNGELSKSLDAYFGEAAQTQSNVPYADEGAENSGHTSDFGHDSTLKDSGDEMTNDSSSSPPSANDSLSPSKSSSSKKAKVKSTHLSTSLQNREKRKTLRLYGKQYTTPSGKTYPERKIQEKDCSKCRYNCSTNISTEQRQAIFEHFWSLNSYVKRLYYYCQSIKEKPAKTMKHTRECSREYTFRVEGERVRVCKGFYLATLDVSDKAVRIAMEKRKRGKGMWDKRGAHPPHNKTRPEDKDRVRNHIESFLIIDIYTKTCENSLTTPGQDLNITKMHQDYVSECSEENREPVSEDVYRKTFHTEYNLTTVQV